MSRPPARTGTLILALGGTGQKPLCCRLSPDAGGANHGNQLERKCLKLTVRVRGAGEEKKKQPGVLSQISQNNRIHLARKSQ